MTLDPLQRAILWLYNDGKPREYKSPNLRLNGGFEIQVETLKDLYRQGLIVETDWHGVFKLSEDGEEQAFELYHAGKSWRF